MSTLSVHHAMICVCWCVLLRMTILVLVSGCFSGTICLITAVETCNMCLKLHVYKVLYKTTAHDFVKSVHWGTFCFIRQWYLLTTESGVSLQLRDVCYSNLVVDVLQTDIISFSYFFICVAVFAERSRGFSRSQTSIEISHVFAEIRYNQHKRKRMRKRTSNSNQ